MNSCTTQLNGTAFEMFKQKELISAILRYTDDELILDAMAEYSAYKKAGGIHNPEQLIWNKYVCLAFSWDEYFSLHFDHLKDKLDDEDDSPF